MTAVVQRKRHTLDMPQRRLRAGSPRGSGGVSGEGIELLARNDARRYGVNRLNQSSANSDSQGSEGCLDFPDDLPGAFIPEAPLPSARERMARIVRTIEQDIIPRLVQAHRPALQSVPAAVAVRVAQADEYRRAAAQPDHRHIRVVTRLE